MPKSEAVQVTLDARSRKLTTRLVKSGRYGSPEEVARAAYRLLEEEEKEFAETVEGIRSGIADMEAGRTRPMEDVFADLERKYPMPKRTRRSRRAS